jgi:predicted Ser/Thr protein kinase
MNPPSSSDLPVLPPDDLFLRLQAALAGEYSIERELGRGGMGVVYLAREVRLAREVAIKVLPPTLADIPGVREQFFREAQTAARLSHPNIVPIHRVDEADGFVYFVMAYIAGETLAQHLQTHGPLPPHRAARLLREVAWALTYAHASGIVHRDVKADNILLERGAGRALVTDFGIAGAAHDNARTGDGQIAGTAHYASPEQITGQPLDAASDLYSLGVVGFFALTGRLPFDAPTTREVVAMHLNTRAPSIASIAPTVPLKLAQIVERCLAKRPAQRFASAAALAEAIDQAVEPPREIPAPVRVWLARMNRGGVGKPLLVAYLLAGTLVPVGITTGISAFFLIPVGVAIGASLLMLPSLIRTNRLLAAGYGIDDIRLGLREHWLRRREEIAYELRSPAEYTSAKTIAGIFGLAVASTAMFGMLASVTHSSTLLPIALTVSAIATIATGVLTLGRFIRLRLPRAGTSQIKFWNGKWGDRFVRLAGLGLKKRAPSESLSQLTEVALGRATDALYDALPKELRRQLKQLPAAVRRLEEDAKTLRMEIDKLDASILTLDGDARGNMPSAITASAHEDRLRADRDQLRADLRVTRERAGDRLAATVAALENIRLDLLRLQLGSGHVDSVTASLEAAQQVAEDLGSYVEATQEVEASLVAPHPASPARSPRDPRIR